ncbi:penicillin-binding protein activator [Larsenimonas rhizosphaerae]|uniref:penicillin-binding protein activator n=1 Tax=Larsenimonas rhizosphaerae TaxID=2944682 RepID=UPI00203419F1|nr:penicillin-binding protein activator [Larsenimonas rhizosphaerae]MCM2131054.1 penicillin-binding protein activator [Larsenimonas rhizosphaerae]
MRTSWRSAAAIAAITLTLGGCAGSSISRPFGGGEPSAQALITQARQQQGAEAATTRLQAAGILARQDRTAQALDLLKNMNDTLLPADGRVQWALLTSQTAITQHDGKSALTAIESVESIPTSDSNRQTLAQRKGEALGLLNQPLKAAITLITLQNETDDTSLNDAIWRQVARLDETQLNTLSDTGGWSAGWISLAQVARDQGGDLQQLFDAVSRWQQSRPSHPASRRLPSDLAALGDAKGRQISRIAVFLPESGPLKTIADSIREGIRTRNSTAASAGEQMPQITFHDSSGQDIKRLYAQAMMEGAQLVIGPLDKDKVTSLEQMGNVPVTTLALNYGTSDTNKADNLYEYGLSAEDEAREAAHRAWVDGHRNPAVMVPDNDWGQRVMEAFQQRWQQEGGQLASSVSYDPKGSVASAVSKALRSGRTPDALFLLALPGYARQIPPTLNYYYANNLPVYGTSHLYQGTPQPHLDHDMNGVLFCDIPWQIPDPAAGGKEALPFADDYRQLAQGDSPSLLKLKAMGVDALELGRRLPLIQQVPASEMRGATGTLHLGPQHRFQRILPWAQFKNGIPSLPTLTSSSSVNVDESL